MSNGLHYSTPITHGGFIPSFFEGQTPVSVIHSMTKSNHSKLYCKKLPSGIPKHHQWVLGLTLVEKDSVTNGEWLSDRIIDVGQKLLKQKFPHVAGLQCTCLGQKLQFAVQTTEFIQILHNGSGHWVTISNIGCVAGEVRLFDSLSVKPTTYLEGQIASLVHTDKKSLMIR